MSGLTIEQLEITVRTYNCLKRKGINYTDQLVCMTEKDLLTIPKFGKTSLKDLIKALGKYDIALKVE